MLEQAFEVATEFRFDVGQAMLNTKALKDSVDQISNSANSAMNTLGYLAGGLVAHLGFGSGGLLSLLGKAVQISEAFNASTLNFANNISSNMQYLTGTIGTFNDRLGTSEMIMDNISDTAIKFGIDQHQLASMAQVLATPLALHGKLGHNYENAIAMGTNLSLASEAVGLNPRMSSEMLSRAITDHMSIHGALFARLVNTQAFHNARVMTQPQLMNMQTEKKIDLLTNALKQLAGDADFVAARMHTLGAQFTNLKNQMEVLLKPIGDAIKEPIIKMLSSVNVFLSQHGKEIGKNIAAFITDIFKDPVALFTNLLQLRRVGGDFRKSIRATEIYSGIMFIVNAFTFLRTKFNGKLLAVALEAIGSGFARVTALGAKLVETFPILGVAINAVRGFISGFFADLSVFGVLRGVFSMLASAWGAVMPIFFGFMMIFQGISRAMALAHVEDMKALTAMLPRFTAVMVRWKNVITMLLSPFQQIIEEIGQALSPLFRMSNYLGFFVDASEGMLPALEGLGYVFAQACADIHGFSAEVKAELGYLWELPSKFMEAATSGHPLAALKDLIMQDVMTPAHDKAYGDFMDDWKKKMGDPNSSSTKYTVNNNTKIDARFDMREQLEPDRIAFAVTEKLRKLVINPQQGRGVSLRGALASGPIAGNRQ